ncbi:MAG: hypothetical protein JSV04_10080 [Candidatus Heimdallarchaeota archaeon]|nr:MAG: hypothetical protein JSV04_10080 [Candidatus Heimdallarchaeota archaeon]
MHEIHKMSRGKLLARAKNYIFSTALEDSASSLCRLNMRYGLAKMHLVQEKLGMEPNTSFIAGPDCTITRNLHRWRNGIGYGGKITWGDGMTPLIFSETMPNACGMLVGSLDEIPDPTELIQRIHEMNAGEVEIEGVPIKWNFGSGNHFINVFEVIPNPAVSGSTELPQYSFITHSSPSELRTDDNKFGIGLYYHTSPNLRELTDTLETPFGDINYLIDDAARKFFEFYLWVDQMGAKRRILAGELLFGEFNVISNTTHQGMVHLNEVALGTHVFKNPDNRLFPLALRADLPCYLLKGYPNFTEEAMEGLNFTERARHQGLEERLRNANILPHGGGYTFPHIVAIPEIFETVEKRRYFSVDLGTGIGSMMFETPRELQFSYRGRNVVVRATSLGLGEIVATMVPRFALKI